MTERSRSRGHASADVGTSTPVPVRGAGEARRRHALSYLSRFEYPVELRTLAAHVAAEGRNLPVETVGQRVVESVAVALHHVDLPKLVATGVVRYDPESRMIVYADTPNPIERYADVTERSRRSDAD